MHDSVQSWVINHYETLKLKFQNDYDTLIYIEAFLTQYELISNFLLEQSVLDKIKSSLLNLRPSIWQNQNKPEHTSDTYAESKIGHIDILFWPWQPNHLEVTSPLFAKLEEAGIEIKLCSHHPRFAAQFESAHNNLWLPLPISINKQSSFTKALIYQKLEKETKTYKPIYYNGKKLQFTQVLKLCFQWYFELVQETILHYRWLTANFSISSIFIGNDLTLVGRVIIFLAKAEDIKTFSYMHGSIKSILWKYISVDRFYVYGIANKKRLLELGVDTEKITVAGSTKMAYSDQENTNKTLNPHPYKHSILIAFSGPGHSVSKQHHRLIIDELTKVVDHFRDTKFIIKLHQKDKAHYYAQLLEYQQVQFIDFQDKKFSSNIYDWVKNTDLTITTVSTSAVEALAFQKPSLCIDVLGHFKHIPFIKEKACIYCRNHKDLVNAINELKQNGFKPSLKAIEYAEQYFYSPEKGVISFLAKDISQFLIKRSTIESKA